MTRYWSPHAAIVTPHLQAGGGAWRGPSVSRPLPGGGHLLVVTYLVVAHLVVALVVTLTGRCHLLTADTALTTSHLEIHWLLGTNYLEIDIDRRVDLLRVRCDVLPRACADGQLNHATARRRCGRQRRRRHGAL